MRIEECVSQICVKSDILNLSSNNFQDQSFESLLKQVSTVFMYGSIWKMEAPLLGYNQAPMLQKPAVLT